MKNMKMSVVLIMISLSMLLMIACNKTKSEVKKQSNIQSTGIGQYKRDIEVAPAPVAPTVPVAPQTPQRTVIENGEVIVWAETFNRDETIKPQSIIYEEKGHKIFYNVDGKEIMVAVNAKSGDRYFYDDGGDVNFASIGKSVKDSNENILLQVKINKMLNEEVKKKYK